MGFLACSLQGRGDNIYGFSHLILPLKKKPAFGPIRSMLALSGHIRPYPRGKNQVDLLFTVCKKKIPEKGLSGILLVRSKPENKKVKKKKKMCYTEQAIS